jgi:hypothetical protein
VPRWFERLFPKKTLAGVRAPTAVRVEARVASPNRIVSPISGLAAAVIGWRFYAHFMEQTGRNEVERYALLWNGGRGEDLVLETPEGTVLVPAEGRLLQPAVEGRGVSLDVPLPPEAAHLMREPNRGAIFYDELLLRTGDRVRLRATVAPSAKDSGSAYRASGERRCDFEALPRLGPVVVEDRPFDG